VIVLVALLLLFCLCSGALAVSAVDGPKGTTFEVRAAAEKESRSRYRDLEVASLVIILVAGGAATLWAIRRKKP
jgi:hypothetical protein